MAIKLAEATEVIKVICHLDDCINCTDEEYEKYLETLDESILQLSDEADKFPVRFVLRTELNYKAQRQIKKDQVSVSEEGGMGVNMGFTMLDIRLSLIDIEHPSSPKLEFSKGKDGLADQELVARLDSYGIAQDLYNARQNAIKPAVSKKN